MENISCLLYIVFAIVFFIFVFEILRRVNRKDGLKLIQELFSEDDEKKEEK